MLWNLVWKFEIMLEGYKVWSVLEVRWPSKRERVEVLKWVSDLL